MPSGLHRGPPVDGNKAIVPINDKISLTGSSGAIDGLNMSNNADIYTNGHGLNVTNPRFDAITTIQSTGISGNNT